MTSKVLSNRHFCGQTDENITIKMEIEEEQQDENQLNYEITESDLHISFKEEPATDFLSTEIKTEPGEEENIDTNDHSYAQTEYSNAIFFKPEPAAQLMEYDINDAICPVERSSVEELLQEDPKAFCNFTGLPNVAMFYKIYSYIEEEIQDLPETSKLTQLFSVLTKLHTNVDNYYMDKYKFLSTYVSVIDLLYEKLKTFWKLEPKNPYIPTFLRNFFPQTYKTVVIARVLKVDIRKRDGTTFAVKYAVGFTSFGTVLIVSEGFISTTDACDLLNATNSSYIFERDDEVHVRNVSERRTVPVNNGDVIEYYVEVTRRLTDRFKVLLGTFPEYMLRKSTRNVSFLYKLVSVCCVLFNIVWLQQMRNV